MHTETLERYPGAVAEGYNPRGVSEAVAELLKAWKRRYVTRRALANLDNHMLRDIGMTAEERAAEVKKFPWEV